MVHAGEKFNQLQAGQEKVGHLGMSFSGNLTCLQEIFCSNIINF